MSRILPMFLSLVLFSVGQAREREVTLASMGVPPLTLQGSQAETDLFLPLPPGARPQSLLLKVVANPDLDTGYLALAQGGRVLSALPVRPGVQTLRFALREARAERQGLGLRLILRLRSDNPCQAARINFLQILPEGSRISFWTGERAGVIAEALEPSLSRLLIFVPNDQRAVAEQLQMILWLAAYVGRSYKGRLPQLVVLPHPGRYDDLYLGEGESAVALGGPPGARVVPAKEGVVLEVSGLDQAQRLWADPRGFPSAVFSSEVEGTTRLPQATESRLTKTLAELGYGSLRAQGVGDLVLRYTFSLADFGYRRYPFGFNLRLAHSPVPEERAYLEVRLNGTSIAFTELRGTRLSAFIPINERNLRRDNQMELVFNHHPVEGECSANPLPFVVTVDSASAFSLKEGQPLSGFDALPQEFLGGFEVYLGFPSLANVALAAQLIAALQETTRTPLQPRLSFSDVGASLLIGTAGLAEALGAPVRGDFRVLNTRGELLWGTRPGEPFAVAQAYVLDGRHVLLLTSSSAGKRTRRDLLRPLVERLLENGWYGVRGDTALIGASGVVHTFRREEVLLARSGEPPIAWFYRYRFYIYVLGLVIVLLLLFLVYPRLVRKNVGGGS